VDRFARRRAGTAKPSPPSTVRSPTAARHPAYVFLETEVRLAQAWVAAAEGSVSEALALARQAAEVTASQHQPAVEVFALHTAVCFGDRTVADRLAQLATQVDGPAPMLRPRTPPLWLPRTVQRCTPPRSNSNKSAPYCWPRMPPPRSPPFTPAKSGAAPLTPPPALTNARTPALAALTAPLPLTHREHEIVTLAASGLSNREIAQRLVVSVRTVENHLYRASTHILSTALAAS
jgi:DNA-binding CsgD family transcriptional regulator